MPKSSSELAMNTAEAHLAAAPSARAMSTMPAAIASGKVPAWIQPRHSGFVSTGGWSSSSSSSGSRGSPAPGSCSASASTREPAGGTGRRRAALRPRSGAPASPVAERDPAAPRRHDHRRQPPALARSRPRDHRIRTPRRRGEDARVPRLVRRPRHPRRHDLPALDRQPLRPLERRARPAVRDHRRPGRRPLARGRLAHPARGHHRWTARGARRRAPGPWSDALDQLCEIIADLAADPSRAADWRIQHVGTTDGLPEPLVAVLTAAQDRTAGNRGLHVNLAVGYGGRREIADAMRSIVRDHGSKGGSIDDLAGILTPELIGEHLYTQGQPDPDLIIRTSGEQRLSDFMLWQSAHSEFYFVEALGPDLREVDFLRALRAYATRHR